MFFNKDFTTGEKIEFGISHLLRATLIIAIIVTAFQALWTDLFISALALLVTFLPALLNRNYKLRLPIEFEFVLTVFIYSSFFLGEIGGFYTKFWWWDIVLHASAGIALGFIGFLILYSLYISNRFKMSPILIALFAFAFASAIGTVWEIFEFFIDSIAGLNMQKSGLVDTMWDLIVNNLGALLTSTVGYFYIKRKENEKGIFHYLIKKFLD